MTQNFPRLFKPSATRQPFQIETGANPVIVFLKDGLRLQTIIAIGAIIQALLLAILPIRVALTPATLYLILRLITTSLEAKRITSSSYTSNIAKGKVTAQLAPPTSGEADTTPASQPVVVFMLGVRFNHPLGIFSPGAVEITNQFTKMQEDLSARAKEYGLLGASSWQGTDRQDTNQLLVLYYFQDMQRLNQFAHDPVHRKGWDWFNRAKMPHIGIMHEAFQVPAACYESIYVNFPPTMMGATTRWVRTDGEEGTGEWVGSLVPANKGPLRSQFGRMARSAGKELEKYGEEIEWEGQEKA